MQEPTQEVSVFQTKYNEFIEDLLGALPEYTIQIQAAKSLDDKTRLTRFQDEVKTANSFGSNITSNINLKSKSGNCLNLGS